MPFKFVNVTFPCTATTPVSETQPENGAPPDNQQLGKRKRGRPRGSKKKKLRSNDRSPSVDNEKTSSSAVPCEQASRSHLEKGKSSDTAKKGEKSKLGGSSQVTGSTVKTYAQPSCPPEESTSSTVPGPQTSSPTPPMNPPMAHMPSHHHSDNRFPLDRARQRLDEESLPNAHVNTEPTTFEVEDNLKVIEDDIEDTDELDSFVFEGLGDENDMEDEGDIQDNEQGPRTHEQSGSSSNKRPRRPLPQWFQELFNHVVSELNADRRGLHGRSRHYLSQRFWLPRESVWFHLQKQNVKPTDLFVPNFFIWDPHDLVGTTGISCPNCNRALTRDGILNYPRRVVDVDSCFWLVGYVYACRKISGGCGSKFRSWNPKILAKLPRQLAAEFPAYLSWRSGISWRAFGIVRSCIQYGMGTNQIAEMFRMQHVRSYDELRLQYLHTKISRINSPVLQQYTPFLPFDDQSDIGFNGFTPSGQWIRDIYDDVMESHRDTLNQHTAMLSGKVCAIDHSHKISKHVFKVEGASIFTALLTVTNERGEIRVCIFVATKSHSQFIEVLRKMSQDLTLYGHSQPEVFYTDSMADKAMLESVFPSLLADVVAVEKYSHLPKFSLPDLIRPSVLRSTSEINNVLRGILDDIPLSGQITVGFDSEWNVDISASGHITGSGPPEVIQIAYKNQFSLVVLHQIGQMLTQLPHELLNFLQDSRVIKAGRQVNGDLRRLAIATGHEDSTFQGGLDLATYAKERLVTTNGQMSLADLTAVILGQCLAKDQVERVDCNWSNLDLSDSQIQYASRDAWVSLCLFNKISQFPEPKLLPTSHAASIGLPVVILTEDHKNIAARGRISSAVSSTSIDGINITPTRTVVTVTEVLVPATIMSQHRKQSLQQLGLVPFDTVAHRTHIRVIGTPTITSYTVPLPSQPLAEPDTLRDTSPDVESPPSDDDNDMDREPVGNAMLDAISPTSDEESNIEHTPTDSDSVAANCGREVLGPSQLNSHEQPIHSRVIKD
ncbi:hypothetical protein H0H93_007293, partial [Arthromyces matolae]